MISIKEGDMFKHPQQDLLSKVVEIYEENGTYLIQRYVFKNDGKHTLYAWEFLVKWDYSLFKEEYRI